MRKSTPLISQMLWVHTGPFWRKIQFPRSYRGVRRYVLLGILIFCREKGSCDDVVRVSLGYSTIPSCLSQRGKCHSQCQEAAEPRHLISPPRTCFLPPPTKLCLHCFPLADTMPWTLQLQGAILRTRVLSSCKALRFIHQMSLQGLVSQLGKCLQLCHCSEVTTTMARLLTFGPE